MITPDGQYLHEMAEGGVKWTDPAGVIHDGHKMCDYLDAHPTPLGDMVTEVAARSPGMNTTQVRAVVMAAVNVYCPQDKDN